MSTRCHIGFYQDPEETDLKQFEALIYRHSDGYPGTVDGSEYGVLADIVPYLKWFDKERGLSDTEYAAARLLQFLCNEYDQATPTKEIPTGTLGHGICRDFHGDHKYYYAVYSNRLEVYDCDFDAPPEKWKKIETVNLKP
jgi:hypothetical protein